MRLLVTRPEPDASLLAEELRGLGHEPIVQPLLDFHRLDFDPAPLESASYLIFTSGNAIRALQERRDIGRSARIPVFCAGEETTRRARAAGFSSIAATASTAEDLAAKIVPLAGNRLRLVHVTAKHQAFDLAGALACEGLSLCTLYVYEMTARRAFESSVAEALKAGTIGDVILMSPRTGEIFTALCRDHGLCDRMKSLRYFCLAQSVAKTLEPAGLAQVHVAEKPNRKALLALIAASPRAGQDRVKQEH